MGLRQVLTLIGLAVAQRAASQCLDRELEPTTVMDDVEQVEGYRTAGDTTLDLIYCLAVETIHLGLRRGLNIALLDLGCGTGKFTARLARAFRPSAIRAWTRVLRSSARPGSTPIWPSMVDRSSSRSATSPG